MRIVIQGDGERCCLCRADELDGQVDPSIVIVVGEAIAILVHAERGRCGRQRVSARVEGLGLKVCPASGDGKGEGPTAFIDDLNARRHAVGCSACRRPGLRRTHAIRAGLACHERCACGDVMRPAVARREPGYPCVETCSAVIIGIQRCSGTVPDPHERVAQRAIPAVRAFHIEPVRVSGLQRHREPVGVKERLDVPGPAPTDGNRAGRRRVVRIVVRRRPGLRRTHAIRAGLACHERCACGDVMRPAVARREPGYPCVETCSAVIIGIQRCSGTVPDPHERVAQRAIPAVRAFHIEPVRVSGLQRHREPVGVKERLDVPGPAPTDGNRAGRRRVVRIVVRHFTIQLPILKHIRQM